MKITDIIGLKDKHNRLVKTGARSKVYFVSESLPSEFIEFYSEYEPAKTVLYNSVDLCGAKEMKVENERAVPGEYVHPLGFSVFATDCYGNAYCIDTKHKLSDGFAVVFFPLGEFMGDETESEILAYGEVSAAAFVEFIQSLKQEDDDEEELIRLAAKIMAEMKEKGQL